MLHNILVVSKKSHVIVISITVAEKKCLLAKTKRASLGACSEFPKIYFKWPLLNNTIKLLPLHQKKNKITINFTIKNTY